VTIILSLFIFPRPKNKKAPSGIKPGETSKEYHLTEPHGWECFPVEIDN